MKIGFFGKGGSGKSVVISLLARYYVVDAYDANPLGGLRALFPAAKKYDGVEVGDPSLIEFPLLERGFRLVAKNPDVRVALITLPHVHAVKETVGILETLHRYCPNEVIGVIINQGAGSIGEVIADKLGLELLGTLPLEPKLDHHLVKTEGLAGYEPSTRMNRALGELAKNLDLKARVSKEKRRKLGSVFKRLKLWRT